MLMNSVIQLKKTWFKMTFANWLLALKQTASEEAFHPELGGLAPLAGDASHRAVPLTAVWAPLFPCEVAAAPAARAKSRQTATGKGVIYTWC